MSGTSELSELYRARFGEVGLQNRRAVWRTLVDAWFGKLVPADADVLELAPGYGEFLSAVKARKKYAVDLNPDAGCYLPEGTTFINGSADKLDFVADASIDVVFTSNFLEHLPSKAVLSAVMAEALRVLRPGGRFIAMGPNIRFAYREYWDFYDHYLPLSDRSLAEGLAATGFALERVIPRFLPFRMGGGPTPPILIRAYLALPIAWRLMGKQFLVVASKPT